MPEGPTIVILKEEVDLFKGKKVISVAGNTTIDKDRMLNQKVLDFQSWGKHFLIKFKSFSVRVHFLLFGSYRINERKPNSNIRLQLAFSNGELNFYASAVKIIDEELDAVYDWSADIMNDEWNPAAARKKLKGHPEMLICDALLDQQIFSGLGNIIKNEVLFRVRVQPQSLVGAIPARKLTEIIKEVRVYSFQFYEWKKDFVLKKHWQAHTKKICPRCDIPLIKEHLGKTKRRSFYCRNCQVLHT